MTAVWMPAANAPLAAPRVRMHEGQHARATRSGAARARAAAPLARPDLPKHRFEPHAMLIARPPLDLGARVRLLNGAHLLAEPPV